MFTGVKSHHHLLEVASYPDAVLALAAYDQLPSRIKDSPKAVTGIYECGKGAIAFRLYQTDVVTWHPDNSVEIDNFGTKTTTGFAKRFLPNGIHLRYPMHRRDGTSGGDQCILYREAGENRLCDGVCVRLTQTLDGDWVPRLLEP